MEFPYTYFEDEVREGFYITGNLKRAWAGQLEVLSEIDKVCKKHDIRWFIDCGTLLGAVRHGGYIPWDDDMDICMMREDLIKFNRVALYELPQDYVILNMHREDDDFLDYLTRVTNSHAVTFTDEYLEKYHNCPYSIGIDIFPLDYLCPDDEEEELRRELAQKVMLVSESESAKKDDFEALEGSIAEIEELCGVEISREKPLKRQLYKLTEALFSMYSREEATHVGLMPYWISNHDHKYPIECFDEIIMLPFENTYLPAPMRYDDVLKIEYGNYMKIVKGGGVHEYPFYKKQEKHVMEAIPHYPFIYKFDPAHLKKERFPIKLCKQNAPNFVSLLDEAHKMIVKVIKVGRPSLCTQLLVRCQEQAIQLGEQIETEFYEGHSTVGILEEYCELLYEIGQMEESNELTPETATVVEESLNEVYSRIATSIHRDVIERKQIVFIPFRACYWDAMESVWEDAVKADNTDVYVMPIPYYEREVNGELTYMHYEGNEFPEYVPIVNYEEFDIVNRHPDVIYIQNPYDECNFTMCVEPKYFSRFLRKYTEELVYIPYFIMDEIESRDSKSWVTMEYFCTVPGLMYADRVILQSEKMREMYIERLTEFAGEDTRRIWESKIEGSGSPIYIAQEKKHTLLEEDVRKNIPEEWKQTANRFATSTCKYLLVEIGIAFIAQNGTKAFSKIKESFEIMQNHNDKIVIVWKLRSELWTAFSNQPDIIKELDDLVDWYQKNDIGILDNELSEELAVSICSAFYGSFSKLARKFQLANKPILIMDVNCRYTEELPQKSLR